MSLPRPLDNTNKHTLNLTYVCPDKVDHLTKTGATMNALVWSVRRCKSFIRWLGTAGCLWMHAAEAQPTPARCLPQPRTSTAYVVCVEQVDNKFRRAVGLSAYGRCVVGYRGYWRFYPPETHGISRNRYRTTDKNFKAGGDSLMSGYWTVHRKNGQLLIENIYERGYLRSANTISQ